MLLLLKPFEESPSGPLTEVVRRPALERAEMVHITSDMGEFPSRARHCTSTNKYTFVGPPPGTAGCFPENASRPKKQTLSRPWVDLGVSCRAMYQRANEFGAVDDRTDSGMLQHPSIRAWCRNRGGYTVNDAAGRTSPSRRHVGFVSMRRRVIAHALIVTRALQFR